MAVRKNISNISSGIYFTETDLTAVTQAAGTFAGGAIGLTEKGPAFEIMTSASFEERRLRMGDLNPKFPTSYYARAFLNQANNYKEIRILGLEGYTDDAGSTMDDPTLSEVTNKAFVIMLSIPTSTPQAAGLTTPVIATPESVVVVLKPRRPSFTNLAAVDKIEVSPVAGALTATDEAFLITVTFADATTLVTTCSLRSGSKDYISKVFGTDPRDGSLIKGNPSPLWVEFVIPSVTRRPDPDSLDGTPTGESPLDANHALGYYYPGDETTYATLDLVEGDMTLDLSFSYPSTTITNATNATPIVVTAASHGLANGNKVTVTGVGGNTATNGTFYIDNITLNTFELFSDAGLTTPVAGNGTYTTGGAVKLYYAPTWEREVMDFGNTQFQTPVTPFFVSDFNADGEVKRLFRVWSISDGEAANTEIKIEIANIDPTGNGGKGLFDLFVRRFEDKEDTGLLIVEGFRGLTMDPKSDNYIARRIGDGEIFPIRSRFIFIELNEDEPLPESALPYGIEGYPDVAGLSMPDVVWSTEYDRNKTISKQTLGLPSNSINMLAALAPDQLAFKNIQSGTVGKGFHLNPQEIISTDTLYGIVSAEFDITNATAYLDKNSDPVTASEKIKRSKYVVALYGGFDGFNVYRERQWSDPTSKDFEAYTMALDIFDDAESLEADFSVLVTPDVNMDDHSSAAEAALEMVERRGDALYLADFFYDPEANPDQAKTNLQFSEMKSSYAAVYFPYVQIEDDVNKINLFLPPSVVALATIAATATNEQVWQPPAGSLRTIATDLVRVRRRMKLADRETLKSVNINPITLFPGTGFEITESRTTQEAFSALSFIHNRLLLGFAQKALKQSLRPILQQLQNNSLRRAFENTVRPIFDRIQKLNGIESFDFVVLEVDEDRTTLRGQVTIVPLYVVERIIIDFSLTNTGVSFG